MDVFKNKIVLLACASAGLMAIGTALGWFSIENEFVAEKAAEELAPKELAVYIVSVIVIAITALSAKIGNRFLPILSIVVALYGTLVAYNQLPESEELAELIGITTEPWFWLTVIGGLATTAANTALVLKGFKAE